MPSSELWKSLDLSRELEITVTGKKSGRSISLPVWFVHEKGKLLLLPLKGTLTRWYRNLLKTPTIQISFKGTKIASKAKPVADPAKVKEVVEKFRAKYGAGDVKKYYSNFDACVELSLSG